MVSEHEWVKINDKRIHGAWECSQSLHTLVNELCGSDKHISIKLEPIIQSFLDTVVACKQGMETSLKYMEPRIAGGKGKGKAIVNAYPADARFIINRRAPEIADHVQQFGEHLFKYLLAEDEEEYRKLLISAKENLPPGEFGTSYDQELFLKEWFQAESPNEVDLKDVHRQIKRLPKLSVKKVEDFVWGVASYFPEYESELRDKYEKVGKKMIDRNRLASAAEVYVNLGDVEIVDVLNKLLNGSLIEKYEKERALGKEKLPKKYRKLRRDVWNRLGVELGKKGDYSGAVECFKRALDLKDDPKCVLNLADALRDEGSYKEAIATYKDLLARHKRSRKRKGTDEPVKEDYAVKALYGLGVATVRDGDLDGGRKLVRKALELDPNYKPALKYVKSLRKLKEKYD